MKFKKYVVMFLGLFEILKSELYIQVALQVPLRSLMEQACNGTQQPARWTFSPKVTLHKLKFLCTKEVSKSLLSATLNPKQFLSVRVR